MSVGRISKRYAKALFRLNRDDLDEVKKHLQSLRIVDQLFKEPESGKVLVSPVMPPELKRDLLKYGLKIGASDKYLEQFIDTIVDSRREALLPEITNAFEELLNEAEGVAEAEVISAVALTKDDLTNVGRSLGELFGKRVEVKPSVDSSLLGGFVARVGNFRVDMSLKSKLDDLAQNAAQGS